MTSKVDKLDRKNGFIEQEKLFRAISLGGEGGQNDSCFFFFLEVFCLHSHNKLRWWMMDCLLRTLSPFATLRS